MDLQVTGQCTADRNGRKLPTLSSGPEHTGGYQGLERTVQDPQPENSRDKLKSTQIKAAGRSEVKRQWPQPIKAKRARGLGETRGQMCSMIKGINAELYVSQ